MISILYKYHHNTKLYQKTSWVYYCLYCQVTIPVATNKWYFSRYYYGDNDFVIWTFDFIARSDTVHMTYSTWYRQILVWLVVLIWTLMWLVLQNMAFYRLHAAARLSRWLPYIRLSLTYGSSYIYCNCDLKVVECFVFFCILVYWE